MDQVRFFGTTGDKDLMFSNCLSAGGLYLEINNKKIIMDPGPGTFNNFVETFPGDIKKLDAVILSHVHFDHSTDVNAMIEGMTDGGNLRRGTLITSDSAYSGETIHDYLKEFPEKVWLVDKQTRNNFEDMEIIAVKHCHGIPNYGFIFSFEKKRIAIITDTTFFDNIIESYADSTTMIINVPYYIFPKGKKPKHLCIADVKEIVRGVRPKKIILTHFGRSICDAGINFVAKELESQVGIETIAAVKNKVYELI